MKKLNPLKKTFKAFIITSFIFFTASIAHIDIGGTGDTFDFVNQPYTGDVELTAKVESFGTLTATPKAGVMIRENFGMGLTKRSASTFQPQSFNLENQSRPHFSWRKLGEIFQTAFAGIVEFVDGKPAYAQTTSIDFSVPPAIESDPSSKITVTPACVAYSSIETRSTNSYVYKPVTTSGDFTYEFDAVLTSGDSFAGEYVIWGVTNSSNAAFNFWADGLQMAWYKSGSTLYLKLKNTGGSWTSSSGFALNQRYYIRVKRTGTTLTADIYTNLAKSGAPFKTLTKSNIGTSSYSYLYAFSAENVTTTTRKATGDVCNFVIPSAVTTYALSVTRTGNGTGTVSSVPAGINCGGGGACSAPFNPGTVVALSQTPAAGMTFIGWFGGVCNGTGACSVTMDAAKSVEAKFDDTTPPSVPQNFSAAPASSSQINLSWSASTETGGTGLKGYRIYKLINGSYTQLKEVLAPATTTSDTGLNPSTPYSYKISSIDNVNVESVQSGVASASTSAATTTFTLNVTRSGNGTGTVSSVPAGINCGGGGACSAPFNSGTVVALSQTPAAGMTFIGWFGGVCNGTGACSVTMDAAKSVEAKFDDTTPPSVPANFSAAAASSTQIDLSWSASTETGGTGLKGYRIYKLINGSYTQLKEVLAPATTTSDTGLNPSTPYSYKISSIDNVNVESAQSSEASAMTNAASGGLPSPWSNADIGAVAAAGSASFDTATQAFTIMGSGVDIYGTADEFQYVYQLVTGDTEIIAKVESLTNTNSWAKAGVMVRETLTNNAKNIMMAMTPGNGASFQRRTTTGGSSSQNSSSTGLPYWIKLKRQGNSFSGYKSPDGVTWTQVGSTITVTMGAQVYAGLAVTSHNDGVLATAVYKNVTVTVPYALSVTRSGNGTGAVSSNPAGINCGGGGVCSSLFNSGTSVALTPTAGSGFTFINWSGACNGAGPCTVTMDAAKSVDAKFDDITAPNAPTGVNFTGISQNGFNLNWTASTSTDVAGYRIDVATDAGFLAMVPGYDDKNVGNVFTAPVTGLTAGIQYFVRVRAYDAVQNYSNYASNSVWTIPAVPTGLTLTINDRKVDMSWNPVTGATGYKVNFRTETGSYPAVPIDVPGQTTKTIDQLQNGTKYYFKVLAYNASGQSAYTTEQPATPQIVDQLYVSDIRYNAAGLKTSILYGNGVVTYYTYDANLRLKTIITMKGIDPIQNLTYEYDGVGNVTKITDGVSGEVKIFTYDALNRLIQADGNYGPNQSFDILTFDYFPNGNIRTKDGLTYTYDLAQIKPHAVRSVGADTFDYDANGNLWKKTSGGVTTTYTFNTENQLTNISSTGSTFAYDDTGERIKKTFAGTTTKFVGDLYEDAGGVTKQYVFVGGTRVASVAGSTVSFMHGDHLGGTNAVTSSTGTVIDRADYKPFGEFKQHTVASNEGYFFTDQYNDSESGLYYYGARYYNPNVGRFISPDWIVQAPGNTQSLNRYTYAWNNPVNLVDPTGNKVDILNSYNDGLGDFSNFGSGILNSFGDSGALAKGFDYVSLARTVFSIGVDFSPAGPAKSAVELGAGYDYLAGQKSNRFLAALGTVPVARGILSTISKADDVVDLFRAVSKAELDDIGKFGLRSNPGGIEGKQFATSLLDATAFGKGLFKLDNEPFTVIQVTVPKDIVGKFEKFTDVKFPALHATNEQLQLLNNSSKVKVLDSIPLTDRSF